MRRFAQSFIVMLLAVGCAVVSETIARAFVSSPCRLTVGGRLLRLRSGHAEVEIQ